MFAWLSCCPSATQADDLLGLYRMAVDSSPVVAQAQSLLQADQSGQSVARSALAPRLSAGGYVNRSHLELEGFGPAPIDEEYTPASYSVTLTQPLLSGSSWASLKASRAQVRSAAASLLAVQQDLILQVADAYFAILRAESMERAALSQQVLLQKIKDQAESANRVGSGDIIAVEEARARLDAAQSDLISARNAVRVARRGLESLTHQAPGVLADIETFNPEGPVPDRMDDWVETALENQPLLEQAREQVQASLHLVSAAGRARWPTISLNAEYDHADGSLAPDVNRRERFVGVSAVWPLFQGGEISASRRRAEAQAQARQHGLRALEDQVRLNVQRAFLDLEDSVAQLGAARRALESAATALKATQKGYEIGERPVVDVLDSARRHTDAQAVYYGALYNQILARLRLKAAAGVLTEKDVASVNGLLRQGAVTEEGGGE